MPFGIWRKCVSVSNLSDVCYAQEQIENVFQALGNGTMFMKEAGNFIVCHFPNADMEQLTPKEFNERFVTEDNLPPHMAKLFNGMPEYEEWVKASWEQAEAEKRGAVQ